VDAYAPTRNRKTSDLGQLFTIYAPSTSYYYAPSRDVHSSLIHSSFATAFRAAGNRSQFKKTVLKSVVLKL
jgi:hypothetical protein